MLWVILTLALAAAYLAWRLGWLNASGAGSALALALAVWAGGGWPAVIALVAYFLLANLAGLSARQHHPQRNGWQVWANGGAATAGLLGGSFEFYLGALGASLADTAASEVGSRAPWAWKFPQGRVASGSNGAISTLGTLTLVLAGGIFALLATWLGFNGWAIWLGAVSGACADSLLSWGEERYLWWGNDWTNFMATLVGGAVSLAV